MKIFVFYITFVLSSDCLQRTCEQSVKSAPLTDFDKMSNIIELIDKDLDFREILDEYLASGMSINQLGNWDQWNASKATALHKVISKGNIEGFKILRSRGARLDIYLNSGILPHYYSCSTRKMMADNQNMKTLMVTLQDALLEDGIITDALSNPTMVPESILGSNAFIGADHFLLREGLEHALVRPFWDSLYGGSENQGSYERDARGLVYSTAQSAKRSQLRLEDIYYQLSAGRRDIAVKYKHSNAELMGQNRITRTSTNLQDQYLEYLFDRQASLAEIFGKDVFRGETESESRVDYQITGTLSANLSGTRKEQFYELTRVSFNANKMILGNNENKIQHSSSLNFRKETSEGQFFWDSMNQILIDDVEKYEREKLSDEEVLKSAIKIYWWFTQMTIPQRGGAAISNMLLRTYFQIFDKKLAPWKPFLIPDLEALLRNEEDFTKAFPSFFNGTLIR